MDQTTSAATHFMPHGFCYLWDPPLVWTHVLSDMTIGLSYVAISATLVYLVRKSRSEIPFHNMFLAFGLFIVACGATHFMEVVTLWLPLYWTSAGVKIVTAAASATTAVLLPPLIPVVLRTVRDARLSGEHRAMAERAQTIIDSERRFRTLAETLPQIVWTARSDGAVDYFNRRWVEYTGTSPEAGYGWNWKNLVHPDDRARALAAWERSLAAGESHQVELRMRRSSGEYGWVLSRAVPARDERGTILRWTGSATDIDQQKAVEDGLRTSKEAAETANRAKDQFLAVVSHELRTPLNAIIGYADLLKAGVSGPITDIQERNLARISNSSRHLVDLIEQVLSFARAENGRAEPRWQTTQPAELLLEVASLVEPLARERGLDFDVAVPPPDLEVESDPGMLRQIVLNLLSNAVKFTDDGGVSMVARVHDGNLEIEVADTGRGISAEDQSRIFEPFWQGDQSLTRRTGGTGLGLSVTRQLAIALGGGVAVASATGRGSRFTVQLPIAQPVTD